MFLNIYVVNENMHLPELVVTSHHSEREFCVCHMKIYYEILLHKYHTHGSKLFHELHECDFVAKHCLHMLWDIHCNRNFSLRVYIDEFAKEMPL